MHYFTEYLELWSPAMARNVQNTRFEGKYWDPRRNKCVENGRHWGTSKF